MSLYENDLDFEYTSNSIVQEDINYYEYKRQLDNLHSDFLKLIEDFEKFLERW